MATLNTDLLSYAKTVFDKKVSKIYPAPGKYPNCARYDMKLVHGGNYSSTIMDKLPAGFTVGSGGKQTLNGSQSAKTFSIAGDAYSLYLTDELTFEDIEKAAEKGERAYGNLILEYGAFIKEAHFIRNEINFLWGGKPIATFDDNLATNFNYTSGTTASVLIDAGSFIPDAFLNSNMPCDVYTVLDSNGAYTHLNVNAAVVVTGVDYSIVAGLSVVTLYLSGNATDLALINTTNDAGNDRTFEFWFQGSRTTSALIETRGLASVAALVPGDVYKGYTIPSGSQFRGHTMAVGSSFSKAKLEQGLLPAKVRGAKGTKQNPWILNCSSQVLRDLAQELETGDNNFRFDVTNLKMIGNYDFGLMTSAGPVVIEVSDSVPLGSAVAHIHDEQYICRTGAVEASPAYSRMNGKPWAPVTGTNYVSTVSHSHVGAHVTKPANIVLFSGITV